MYLNCTVLEPSCKKIASVARLSLSASLLDSTASPEAGTSVVEHGAAMVMTPAPLAAPLSPRQMVFQELVQTETNYVEILHTIVKVWSNF
jgi:protein ECT2